MLKKQIAQRAYDLYEQHGLPAGAGQYWQFLTQQSAVIKLLGGIDHDARKLEWLGNGLHGRVGRIMDSADRGFGHCRHCCDHA